jgi:glutamyl-tRNA reductase
LFLVDLGMPANVPAPVAAAPGVRLTRLDDLRASATGPEVQGALAIVAGERRRFGLEQARRAARRLDCLPVLERVGT